MLTAVARMAIAAPRRILVVAALIFMAAAVFGAPVAASLSGGGFADPNSESARASHLMTSKFGLSDEQMLITVTAPAGAASEQARRVGRDVVERLTRSPHVLKVLSTWTSPAPVAASMVSKDGKSGLIVVNLKGGETSGQKYAKQLSTDVVRDQDGVAVRAGGIAMVYAQVNDQSERDLIMMETVAFPLSFAVLVWVFGGLLAATLPMMVGLLAIVGSMSVLRLITFFTDVSIFAFNLTAALGLALAIDYTLLIISRFRDELSAGATRDEALLRTMASAGRTVLFSATTVALSMAVMALFPMYFLKSFAYAGVATVALVAIAAIVVTPAAIVFLGARLDALDARRLIRRALRLPPPATKSVEQLFWYRWAKFVMRQAFPIGVAASSLLVFLGAPFFGVKWGFGDDRVLPHSASAHQVGDQLRQDFAEGSANAVRVLIPDATGITSHDFDLYAERLSLVPQVRAVSAPTGTFVDGRKTGPPSAGTGIADGSALLTASSPLLQGSRASDDQLEALHSAARLPTRAVLIGGLVQSNQDSVRAITSRLPLVLGLIAVITFALLFALTGSFVLPLKALVLNLLSLSAAFGALVWIFQDGHLYALGTTPSGTLLANMAILLFCIAFGLSMDYEVFVMARIREYWVSSREAAASSARGAKANINDECVARGIARTGRVVTAAALVMSISFVGLTTAQVSFTRMLGVGLTLAVLADATLVRMVLVPAFMHVLGGSNWWAPAPFARLHRHVQLSESSESVANASPS